MSEISREQVEAAVKVISEWVYPKLENGETVPCPCCDTDMKIYVRKFNSGMARALLAIRHLSITKGDESGWIHVGDKTVGKATCLTLHHWEYEKLPNWGLIEKREERNDAKGIKGGFWRLTPVGNEFALNRTAIPSHAKIFLSECVGLIHDETLTIVQALGKHFNYGELMSDSVFKLNDTWLNGNRKPTSEVSSQAVDR
jgi:hypothetical protein